MNEEPLHYPRCGGESFYECSKVTRVRTGRLEESRFNADDDYGPSYEDDTAQVFSYMCAECGCEWESIDDLNEEIESK